MVSVLLELAGASNNHDLSRVPNPGLGRLVVRYALRRVQALNDGGDDEERDATVPCVYERSE